MRVILSFEWRRKSSHSFVTHMLLQAGSVPQLESRDESSAHRAKLISTLINAELKSGFKYLTAAVNNMQ